MTPAPDSMVERVAMAIYYDRYPKGSNVSLCTWEQADERDREDYRSHARAAIQALREPTISIIRSLDRRVGRTAESQGNFDFEIRLMWQQMIDAALS